MKVLKRIVAGLPGHPGTVTLIMCGALGLFAGGLAGAAIMLGVFGSAYLCGAYERGKLKERSND